MRTGTSSALDGPSSAPPMTVRAAVAVAVALAAGACTAARAHMIAVHGSGPEGMAMPMGMVMDDLRNAAGQDIDMTFRAVGTDVAQREFVGDAVVGFESASAFGNSPLSSARYASLTGSGGAMVHVPLAAGAVNAFHSVPGVPEGLNMTNCALARVFAGGTVLWGDPDIAEHNPGLPPAAGAEPVKVAVRDDDSGATLVMTQYLSACPSAWALGEGRSIAWPAGVTKVASEEEMADFLAQNEYALGYFEVHHGHERGLREVHLMLGDGSHATSLDAGPGIDAVVDHALQNGVLPAAGADWGGVSLVNLPVPAGWPLVHLLYAYVRANLTELGDEGTTMTALLRYILHSKGQAHFQMHGHRALTADAAAASLASVDLITVGPMATEWTFEPETAGGGPTAFAGAGAFVFSEYRHNHLKASLAEVRAELSMMRMHHEAYESDIADHDAAIDNLTDAHAGRLRNLSAAIDALEAKVGNLQTAQLQMSGMLNTHHSRLDIMDGAGGNGTGGNGTDTATLRAELKTMHDTFYVSEQRLKMRMESIAGAELRLIQQGQKTDSKVEQLAIGGIVLAVISILFNLLFSCVFMRKEQAVGSFRAYGESDL